MSDDDLVIFRGAPEGFVCSTDHGVVSGNAAEIAEKLQKHYPNPNPKNVKIIDAASGRESSELMPRRFSEAFGRKRGDGHER